MGFAQWMRVIDTVSGLVPVVTRTFRGPDAGPPMAAGGGLEARMAGVLVSALKEAFDRDSARTELERTHLEAERHRAEQALRAELRRQAADRALTQLRLVGLMAFVLCMIAIVVGVWLPGMRALAPRLVMGAGLAFAIGALGCTFSAWQHVSHWSADLLATQSDPPVHRGASLAPWLLLASLALVAAALLSAV